MSVLKKLLSKRGFSGGGGGYTEYLHEKILSHICISCKRNFSSSSILNLNFPQQPPRSFCVDLDKFQLSTLEVLTTQYPQEVNVPLIFTCLTTNSECRKSVTRFTLPPYFQ